MNLDLFQEAPSAPGGFRYEPELVAEAAQAALIDEIHKLPLQAFDFHGYKANRRVISFGWRYDFSAAKLVPIEPMPQWLLPLRSAVAQFAETPDTDFEHVLISEYAPGAGIGWHRDKAVFDLIVGVSLGAPCSLRFRNLTAPRKWQRTEQVVEPGSMYLLTGEARTAWEHSIAPVSELRYSLTFRTRHLDHVL